MSVEVVDLDTYYAALDKSPLDQVADPPRHQPPTEAFMTALDKPRFFDAGDQTIAVYSFNQEFADNSSVAPLVLFEPHNRGTASQYGARFTNALATHVRQPIIRFDLPGTGKSGSPTVWDCLITSPHIMARSCDRILEQMGVEQLDLLGVCIGGVTAALLAERRQQLARNLLTYVALGLDDNLLRGLFRRYQNLLPEAKACNASDKQILERAACEDDIPAGTLSLDQLPRIQFDKVRGNLFFGGLGLRILHSSPLATLPERLHPNTQWHDWAGGQDVVSDWRSHYEVVTARNQEHPDSSHLTIVRDAGHEWPIYRMPFTAHSVELVLQDQRQAAA